MTLCVWGLTYLKKKKKTGGDLLGQVGHWMKFWTHKVHRRTLRVFVPVSSELMLSRIKLNLVIAVFNKNYVCVLLLGLGNFYTW